MESHSRTLLVVNCYLHPSFLHVDSVHSPVKNEMLMAVHCSEPICETLPTLMGAAYRHCQELCVPDSVDILLHYNAHHSSALTEWCNVLPFHQAEGKNLSHYTKL